MDKDKKEGRQGGETPLSKLRLPDINTGKGSLELFNLCGIHGFSKPKSISN
jgi:hypothetical protein